MSAYEPPTQNLAIFDPDVFTENDEPLTIGTGSKYFLKFPSAQGTENLQTTNVNGVLTANSTSEFKRPLNMSDTTLATNRTINSSFFNFYNSGVAGTLTSNGTLHNQNGSMYLQNTTNGGTINFVLNDAGGVQNTPLQLLTTGNLSNRPLTISANNNFQMNAGTGKINQSITAGDTTTKNTMKLSEFVVNSNNANGGATSFEFYDAVNGKGCFILPNSGNGSLTETNRQNDCCITSRSSQNNNALVLSNWNTNMRNGIRIATTDISGCSIQIQNGQNTTNDYTEFRMAYDRSFNLTTTTFNNVINFNPTSGTGLPNVVSSARRRLEGLGTLSFTDVSGGNTTTGSHTSSIWTDSSLGSSGVVGMYYDCSIPLGYHQFSTRDALGNVSTPIYYGSAITSVANTFIVRNATTPSNRFDTLVTDTQNVNIRARSATASTSTRINVNCDSVDASGVITNFSVMAINPTNIEIRRPIQLTYLTFPSTSSQLGFISYNTFSEATVSSSTLVRNFGQFTIATSGTYCIEVLISMTSIVNNTLTACEFGCNSVNNALPTIFTPSKYTPSLTGTHTIDLSPSAISYLKINFNVNFTSTNNIIYINYLLSYGGGPDVVINGYGSITRIG